MTLGHEVIEGDLFVPRHYPEEFRRKVLNLVAAGRPVAQVAADLGMSDQTIYVLRNKSWSTPDRSRAQRFASRSACVAVTAEPNWIELVGAVTLGFRVAEGPGVEDLFGGLRQTSEVNLPVARP
ncbi:transposase [Nocardia gipuzkoensis]